VAWRMIACPGGSPSIRTAPPIRRHLRLPDVWPVYAGIVVSACVWLLAAFVLSPALVHTLASSPSVLVATGSSSHSASLFSSSPWTSSATPASASHLLASLFTFFRRCSVSFSSCLWLSASKSKPSLSLSSPCHSTALATWPPTRQGCHHLSPSPLVAAYYYYYYRGPARDSHIQADVADML